MELRQQVLQDVVSLIDDDIAMMKLQSFLLSLKEEEKKRERIPGLPYTEEERRADLLQAENEIAEGKVIAWNVLEEEIKHDVTI